MSIESHRIAKERERAAFLERVEPIRHLIEDPTIADISLNEPMPGEEAGHVWADYNGRGYEDTGVSLTPRQADWIVRSFLHGKTWSEASPSVSCQAVGGAYRLQAEMPSATRSSPVFTIRKYTASGVRIADYVSSGEMAQETADALVEAATRPATILTAGETGAGKTTLTNALLLEAGAIPGNRILTIEDTPELERPNSLSLQLVVSHEGPFRYADALKSALRHKPKYIVLGELRPDGDEAFRAISAWRSGHRGMATLHAESCDDMLHTLLSLCRQSDQGRMLTERDVARYVHTLVHVRRVAGRRVFDVCRVEGWNGTEFVLKRMGGGCDGGANG